MDNDPDAWDYPDIPPPPPRLPLDRNHRNSFQSPRNQPERDAWAASRWTINRWTYQKIATALGLSSKSTAHDTVQRGLHTIQQQTDEDLAKARAAHRARLGYALEVATGIMATDHVHVSQGRVMKGDDDTPLIDDGPKLAAAGKVKELSESLRKLDGLDAPAKTESTVTVAPQDIELAGIIRQTEAANQAEEARIKGEGGQ
jgi:hypothetical protein